MKNKILIILSISLIVFLGHYIYKVNIEDVNERLLKESEKLFIENNVNDFKLVYSPSIDKGCNINGNMEVIIDKESISDLDYLKKIFPRFQKSTFYDLKNESGMYRSIIDKQLSVNEEDIAEEYFFVYQKRSLYDKYTRSKRNVVDVMVFSIQSRLLVDYKGSEFSDELKISSNIKILGNYRGITSKMSNLIEFFEIEKNDRLSIKKIEASIIKDKKKYQDNNSFDEGFFSESNFIDNGYVTRVSSLMLAGHYLNVDRGEAFREELSNLSLCADKQRINYEILVYGKGDLVSYYNSIEYNIRFGYYSEK